ncbi:MAG: hypothetical protein KAU20_00760 [Nanoarchaeota archaeon]|nr:hypothetical protein [Nanoarchaeota archaeon]
MFKERKINAFEKLLLATGILVIITGYIFIHSLIIKTGISWMALQAMFLWLILLVLVILTAVNENTKEELKMVINNQLEEIKLLRVDFKERKK